MVKRVDRSSAFAKKLRISTEQRQQWTKDGGGFWVFDVFVLVDNRSREKRGSNNPSPKTGGH